MRSQQSSCPEQGEACPAGARPARSPAGACIAARHYSQRPSNGTKQFVNPYLDLTDEFNRGDLRAIVSSGQAVVLLRLSVTSKDGDWILKESPDALTHVLGVLAGHGAHYRFGAPLDVRWMAGGWSAHLEFPSDGLRLRTDFVTRPPRLPPAELAGLWEQQRASTMPYVDARRLVALKQTGRERDYAVIGELARLIQDPAEQLLASRSVDDLVELATVHTKLARDLQDRRPLLAHARSGSRDELASALDAERRVLMAADVRRLDRYASAAAGWAAGWPSLQRELAGLPLAVQHERIVARALDVLPFVPSADGER